VKRLSDEEARRYAVYIRCNGHVIGYRDSYGDAMQLARSQNESTDDKRYHAAIAEHGSAEPYIMPGRTAKTDPW
jgi:hypothetical protein